jgi:hypothetical protein
LTILWQQPETSVRHGLLPDTEFGKNIIQLIFICDFTGYFAQVMQATPDIKGQQIAR